MRTTSLREGPALADAAQVLAARHTLDALLERLAVAPLDPVAVGALQDWLEKSYPTAAAALDRLEASGATASPPPPTGRRTTTGAQASCRVRALR